MEQSFPIPAIEFLRKKIEVTTLASNEKYFERKKNEGENFISLNFSFGFSVLSTEREVLNVFTF